MKNVTRLIYTSLLIAGTLSASTAMACTTDLWNGGVEGTPVAGSPTAVSRVSGLCAMELTGTGSVKDTSPAAETTAIMRFYVFAELLSGAPVIFEAFSDDNATSSLLTVSFDGSNFVFDAGAGASGNVPGKSKVGWNLVELAWTGGGTMEYWVNTDSNDTAATGSVAAAGGTMESVVLGTADALDGILTFDDYESHRSTPVGGVLLGDSDGSAIIDVFDMIGTQKEILQQGQTDAFLADGQPDCNLSGAIDVFDMICTQKIILTQQ